MDQAIDAELLVNIRTIGFGIMIQLGIVTYMLGLIVSRSKR